MTNRFSNILLLSGALLISLSACNNNNASKTNGPIVLGDSSAIVTEGDPQKLKDIVTDLEPTIPPAEAEPEEAKPADTTSAAKPAEVQQTQQGAQQQQTTTAARPPAQPALEGAGLKAAFKDVTVLIPNLNAKQAGNRNLERANGAVYTYNDGNINGNQLKVSGNVTRVSMRYQTTVLLKTEYGTFTIDGLSTNTEWQPMKGNGSYPITGLDTHSLEYSDAGPAAIRNAVERALHRRRLSRRKVAEIMDDFPRVRSANQKPLSVVLRSVMWKIDGKDDRGRMYSKQIRIDMPI